MTNVDKILDLLKELSLLEASELVTKIEETFNVSAAAPVAAAVVGGAAAAPEAAAEKSEFTVKISSVAADKKIAVIKEVKTIMNIGLADAKTKVEGGEFVVAENVKKDDAAKMKELLVGAGATVELV
jgi:large subunit ribosomal protein L7/L12